MIEIDYLPYTGARRWELEPSCYVQVRHVRLQRPVALVEHEGLQVDLEGCHWEGDVKRCQHLQKLVSPFKSAIRSLDAGPQRSCRFQPIVNHRGEATGHLWVNNTEVPDRLVFRKHGCLPPLHSEVIARLGCSKQHVNAAHSNLITEQIQAATKGGCALGRRWRPRWDASCRSRQTWPPVRLPRPCCCLQT